MTPRLKSIPILAEHGFFRMAYAEWGPEDAPRTVLCVHGVSRNGRDFDFLAQRLAKQNIRVVAPDLPGRGRSDWMPYGHLYNEREYSSALAVLIARLDVTELDWVGTSLGGYVGMLLAAKSGTPIRRLVLNDMGPRITASGLNRIGRYLSTRWSFSSMEDVESHLREIYAPFGDLDERQWAHLLKHSTMTGEDGTFRFHFDPKIGERFSFPLWIDHSSWDHWERIQHPVLVLRGAKSDLLSAATLREMAKRGPIAERGGVRTVEIPDAGHAPSLLVEHQIKLVADFLTETAEVAMDAS